MPTTAKLAALLLETAPEREGWSIVESPNSHGHYEELRQWASELSYTNWTADIHQRKSHLGLVLLWLESEAARRHFSEGVLWPVLRDKAIIPWHGHAFKELFVGEAASARHRELLECAARKHSVRHTFDDENGQNWYRLILLQFGFTRTDAKKHLALWLSGYGQGISAQILLPAKDLGAREFQFLWNSLRQFRLGRIEQATLESRLRANPWVLPEWCGDLVEAAKRSSVQPGDVASHEAAEIAFFEGPELRWQDAELPPEFAITLCNLDQLGLTAKDYELKADDQILTRIVRQPDGRYLPTGANKVVLACRPSLAVSLVASDGTIASYTDAVLWSLTEEVTLYSIRTGRAVPASERIRQGSGLYLIASGDVTIEPAAVNSTQLALGYSLHKIEAGWVSAPRALLDEDVVWSSDVGAAQSSAQHQQAVMARFTQTLDLSAPEWRNKPSPWRLPLHFEVPVGFVIDRLRWRRSDGQLVELDYVPRTLSLVEADAVRPLYLRIRIKSKEGTSRTQVVPVSVPFAAALRWDSAGRPHHHPEALKLLLSEANQYTWTFSLPQGAPDPRSCYYVEGNRVHGQLSVRPKKLPKLSGYGASLRILEDPYNRDVPIMTVALSILNNGQMKGVSRKTDPDGFHIRSVLTELGPDHRLRIWRSDPNGKSVVQELRANELQFSENGWVWLCAKSHDITIYATALEFRGECIGSYFDSRSWSVAINDSPPGTAAQVAVMLRAWKAPLLDASLSVNLCPWLRNNLSSVIPAFSISPAGTRQSGPGGGEWKISQDGSWQSAVNELLTIALPVPDTECARSLVEHFFPGPPNTESLGAVLCWHLAPLCPILAARVVRSYLALFPRTERQKFFNMPGINGLFSAKDDRAEEIGREIVNRDGNWVKQTVPDLASIDQLGTRAIRQPYRILATNEKYRRYALGHWMSEIQAQI